MALVLGSDYTMALVLRSDYTMALSRFRLHDGSRPTFTSLWRLIAVLIASTGVFKFYTRRVPASLGEKKTIWIVSTAHRSM